MASKKNTHGLLCDLKVALLNKNMFSSRATILFGVQANVVHILSWSSETPEMRAVTAPQLWQSKDGCDGHIEMTPVAVMVCKRGRLGIVDGVNRKDCCRERSV